jgi:hypothetical protein
MCLKCSVPEKKIKTEDTNKLTLLAYKIIAILRGNPRTRDSGSVIDF